MTQDEYIKRIAKEMKKQSITPSLYSLQIEQTALAMARVDAMEAQVNKEGMVIVETSDKGNDKHVQHPLLTTINQFHRTITQQLTSLGLNRLKISDAPTDNKKKDAINELIEALK